MKKITTINYFVMIIGAILGLVGFVEKELWVLALIYMFFLGLFQCITGIILFISNPHNTYFQTYIGGLLLFTSFCFLPWEYGWIILPIPLSIYFSFMLHITNIEKT